MHYGLWMYIIIVYYSMCKFLVELFCVHKLIDSSGSSWFGRDEPSLILDVARQ